MFVAERVEKSDILTGNAGSTMRKEGITACFIVVIGVINLVLYRRHLRKQKD